MPTERIEARTVVFEDDEDKTLIRRRSPMARFDTLVFNPETKAFQVWRYKDGVYPGKHEVVLHLGPMPMINNFADLFAVTMVVAKTASLYGVSKVYDLPEPWWGYRFV